MLYSHLVAVSGSPLPASLEIFITTTRLGNNRSVASVASRLAGARDLNFCHPRVYD